MKKLVMVFLTLILLVGCAQKANQPSNKDSKKLKIVTSIYPITDLTKKIVESDAEVTQIMPIGSEAHSWEPGPKDLVKLEEADVFIYNGAGMEHWVEKVLGSLQNKELVVIESSSEVEKVASTHEHEHEHEHEEEHKEEHNHGGNDPHTWVSPKNAKIQLKTIKDGLVKADTMNANKYEENYKKNIVEFDKLIKEFEEAAKNFKRKEIVVTHEAFGYLAKDLGLTQIGIEGIIPTSEPDPARLAEIVKLVKEHQITTILSEELVNPEVAQTIAKEAGVQVEQLNPLGSISQKELDNNQDYFSLMRKNLEALKKALN